MQPLSWDPERDGPLSEAALRAKLEGLGYRCTRFDYTPGTFFARHAHDVDKMDAVLSGRFLLRMQGASVVLGPGDALAVPAGVPHSAEVVGEETVVSLDGVRPRP
jgi:quercetin dioxygenase-like cupin family protein